MSPMEEFEEDLAEIRSYQPHVRRIFWTGANPFAMSYENLKLRALTVRDYLIKCQTMAMFAISGISGTRKCGSLRSFVQWE